MIKRALIPKVAERIGKGKAIILIGARQVGKTTAFDEIARTIDGPLLNLNCDDPTVRNLLSDISTDNIDILIGKNKVIMIDEAQRVADIGLTVKRIIDSRKDVQVLITGSSALGIHDSINEPLTGRKFEFKMFPVSTGEIYETYGLTDTIGMLERRLIYGSYPEIIADPALAQDLLSELSDSYLYKDILEMESVRKPAFLRKLLIALALQTGSEVSFNEVAKTVGSDPRTVERYIDLLEKCFVLFTLPGLSRNMRNELKKAKKIYFCDNGIRNAIINNFASAAMRNDMGQLWENFFIMERIKRNAYLQQRKNYYFWRTSDQKEIDFVEESEGYFDIFEMKWNPRQTNVRFPKAFMDNYECRETAVVTPENYLGFLL